MKRNGSIEAFRCLCMFGVVCIHAFSWTNYVSYHCWALSCPFLIGFMMISGWFGIHFTLVKLLCLLCTVVTCSLVGGLLSGNCSWASLYGTDLWYVWAYVFVMVLSPIIDFFVEQCGDRRKLISVCIFVGVMCWGWSFFCAIFPDYVPTVSGFGGCSGVVLLFVYILTRLMRQLGWIDWLAERKRMLWGIFWVSAIAVYFGFRHNNSIFAFGFALSIFIFVSRVRLPAFVGNIFCFLAPSVFSVYLLHMPFSSAFSKWEMVIYATTHFPHVVCQFLLAILVFTGCVILDMPRRALVYLFHRMHD